MRFKIPEAPFAGAAERPVSRFYLLTSNQSYLKVATLFPNLVAEIPPVSIKFAGKVCLLEFSGSISNTRTILLEDV